MNFQADYFNQSGALEEVAIADNTTMAFNEYLQITTEGGIIGLLLVLAVGWSSLFGRTEEKKVSQKSTIWAVKMSLLAFGIFALFSYPTEILPIKVCVIICFAMIASLQKRLCIKTYRVINSEMVIRSLKIIGSLVGIIILISLIQPLKQQYQAIHQWKNAYLTYQMEAYEASLSDYNKTYQELKYNGEYLVNYGKACSMTGEHNKAIDILIKAERFLPNTILFTALGDSYKAQGQNQKAELAYIKASQILPDRFYPNYLLAKLYDETGQQKKALDMANELLNKDIKIESKAVEEISVEMKAIVNKTKLSSSYIYN